MNQEANIRIRATGVTEAGDALEQLARRAEQTGERMRQSLEGVFDEETNSMSWTGAAARPRPTAPPIGGPRPREGGKLTEAEMAAYVRSVPFESVVNDSGSDTGTVRSAWDEQQAAAANQATAARPAPPARPTAPATATATSSQAAATQANAVVRAPRSWRFDPTGGPLPATLPEDASAADRLRLRLSRYEGRFAPLGQISPLTANTLWRARNGAGDGLAPWPAPPPPLTANERFALKGAELRDRLNGLGTFGDMRQELDPVRSMRDQQVIMGEMQVWRQQQGYARDSLGAGREQFGGQRQTLQQQQRELQRQMADVQANERAERAFLETNRQATAAAYKTDRKKAKGSARQQLDADYETDLASMDAEESRISGTSAQQQAAIRKLLEENQKAQEKLAAEEAKTLEPWQQALDVATERVRDFAEGLDEANRERQQVLRGEKPDADVAETRQLGTLEKLRWREQILRGELERADDATLPEVRSRLRATQKEIDEAEGGTAPGAAMRQTARRITDGLQTGTGMVASAVGGSTGQLLALGAGFLGGAATALATMNFAGLLQSGGQGLASLFQSGQDLEMSSNRLGGITNLPTTDTTWGTRARGLRDPGYNPYSTTGPTAAQALAQANPGLTASDLGYSMAEFRGQAYGLAVGSGSARDLENRTLTNAAVGRAFGVDNGTLEALDRESFRNISTTAEGIGKMLTLFQRSGIINAKDGGELFDTSRLGATLQATAQLVARQQATLTKADPVRAAELISAAEGVGGRGQGAAGLQNIERINNALGTGGSGFQQAIKLEALRRVMPGASTVQLLKAMTEGLYGAKGGEYYAAVQDVIGGISGNNTDLRTILQMDFAGGNVFDAEAFGGAGRGLFQRRRRGTDPAFRQQAIDNLAVTRTGAFAPLNARVTDATAGFGVQLRRPVAGFLDDFLPGVSRDERTAAMTTDASTQLAATLGNLGANGAQMLREQRQMTQLLADLKKLQAQQATGVQKVQIVNPPTPNQPRR